MFRPVQARWFETYVPREQTVKATQVLAETGVVQLETDPRLAEPVDEDRLRYFVERFRALAAEHAHDLPGAGQQASALVGDPVHLANQALHQLRVWSARVEYLKAHVEHLRGELHHLELLSECLLAMQQAGLDMESLFRKTRFLSKSLFACPRDGAYEGELDIGIDLVVPGSQHDFLYIASLPDQRHAVRQCGVERGCEQMGIPAWLSGDRAAQLSKLRAHLAGTRDDLAELEAELKTLRRDNAIAKAKANVDTLHWYLQHAAGTLTEGPYCHVTGWTTARDARQLHDALEKAGIRAVLRSPQPPAEATPPVATLDNWWARPFQPFLVMWGTPDHLEVDPSGLLPIIVPLLFGYMFPDMGHGLLLVLLGLALYRRFPRTHFLIPCGVAAIVFGAVFGEAFGFHDWLPPLWMKPLDDPLSVLAVPLAFGILLMLLGLVLSGVGAYWRGELRDWLLVDGAVLLLYVTLLVGGFAPWVFWLSGLAVGQYFIGILVLATRGGRAIALLNALGQLLLSLFELAINTISFLRVGAFALAHAALSLAMLTLADSVTSPWAWGAIIVLGNLFGMVFEGLLVFVQTTRLVLFEFFIRFLRAEGRLFRAFEKAPGGADKRD